MKILYDHQMFSMQKFGGITRYFSDLITSLPEGYRYDLPIAFSENHHLEEIGLNVKSVSYNIPFRVKRRFYYFKNNRLSNKEIVKNQIDIFHPTYYDDYFLKLLRKPFVITVHDMTYEKYRDTFLFYDSTGRDKRRLAEKAAHIIAISEHTKKDLIELYDIHPEKISVVHHGYRPFCEIAAPLFEDYILYVGERKGYKNFYPFIESIIPLLQGNPEIKVVCTGKMFNKKELALFASRRIERQMIQLFASDAELASLYKYALVFVYPSLYEGFGLPILEAFQQNCPVCLSDASCFPEVAGKAACYFNPTDKESMLCSIRHVIDNKIYADDLRKMGQERLKLFSIDRMVRKTCDVYDKLFAG